MLTVGAYEKCRRYIEKQSSNSEQQERKLFNKNPNPCITISREAGAGAIAVGEILTDMMNSCKDFYGEWTYFDRNLIEKVIEDYNLPSLIRSYMVEDKYKNINHIISDLLGSNISQWTIVHHTTETILQLARMGNAIIVGRGGSAIASKLSNAFHVRLIAPVDARIRHAMELHNLNEKEAALYIKREDQMRKDYFWSFFHQNIDDPTLYHLIINTAKMGFEGTAKLIQDALVQKFAPVLP